VRRELEKREWAEPNGRSTGDVHATVDNNVMADYVRIGVIKLMMKRRGNRIGQPRM
jgi:hypothetical protein